MEWETRKFNSEKLTIEEFFFHKLKNTLKTVFPIPISKSFNINIRKLYETARNYLRAEEFDQTFPISLFI